MHRTQQSLVFILVVGLELFASPGFAQDAEQSAEATGITSRVDKIFEKWDMNAG